MNISPSKAKRTARSLSVAFRKNGIPLRRIEREGHIDNDRDVVIAPGVNHTTLSRIIKSKGTWLPKDPSILTALGLIKPRSPRPVRRLEDLSTEELHTRRARLVKQITHIQNIIAQRKTS